MVKGNDRLPRIIEYQKGAENVELVKVLPKEFIDNVR